MALARRTSASREVLRASRRASSARENSAWFTADSRPAEIHWLSAQFVAPAQDRSAHRAGRAPKSPIEPVDQNRRLSSADRRENLFPRASPPAPRLREACRIRPPPAEAARCADAPEPQVTFDPIA